MRSVDRVAADYVSILYTSPLRDSPRTKGGSRVTRWQRGATRLLNYDTVRADERRGHVQTRSGSLAAGNQP